MMKVSELLCRVFTSKSRSGLLAKFMLLNRLELRKYLLTEDIFVPQGFIHEIWKILVGKILEW